MINDIDTTHLPAAPNSDRIKPLIQVVLQHYPDVQAIYLFGAFNTADRRIYQKDEFAAAEFEILTLSYYQQLNHERAAIIEDILKSGRVYAP